MVRSTPSIHNAATNFVSIFGYDLFEEGDKLWESLQDGVTQFINANGGSALPKVPNTHRVRFEELRKVLSGEMSVEEFVDCN